MEWKLLIIGLGYFSGIYVLIGLILSPWIVFYVINRLDPAAANSGIAFRLLVLPGTIVFWPLLIGRFLVGRKAPPECRTAHDRAMSSDESC